jgi:hypothetical protein
MTTFDQLRKHIDELEARHQRCLQMAPECDHLKFDSRELCEKIVWEIFNADDWLVRELTSYEEGALKKAVG